MPKDDISGLFDKAEEHLLQKAVRRSEPTITDGMLTPSPASAPGAPPPPKPAVPRPRPKPAPPPESEAPPASAQSEPAAPEAEFDPREAPTKQLPGRRGRRVPAPIESSYPSYGPPVELAGVPPSTIEKAAKVPFLRLLMLIAAASAGVSGVVAATGAAVVNIIAALRPPSNADILKRIEGVETRVNGDFGLGLEVQTRQVKDDELKKKIEEVEKAQKALEEKLVVKVKPGRGSR